MNKFPQIDNNFLLFAGICQRKFANGQKPLCCQPVFFKMKPIINGVFFCALVCISEISLSQSIGAKYNQPGAGDLNVINLMVEWPSISNAVTVQQLAVNIHSKYTEKFLSVTPAPNASGLNFQYNSGLMDEENILQIVRMEGVQSAYCLKGHSRMFLNAEGQLQTEEIK